MRTGADAVTSWAPSCKEKNPEKLFSLPTASRHQWFSTWIGSKPIPDKQFSWLAFDPKPGQPVYDAREQELYHFDHNLELSEVSIEENFPLQANEESPRTPYLIGINIGAILLLCLGVYLKRRNSVGSQISVPKDLRQLNLLL